MKIITKTMESCRIGMKTLPNECLDKIFAGLFLQDLIPLRAVSTRWRNIIEEGLRLKRQTSLKLFGSLNDVKLYIRKLPDLYHSFNGSIEYWSLKKSAHQSDDLIINAKHFNIEACDLLVRLFPNVQHLLVCFSRIRLFAQLPYFIGGWSASLKNLSICGKYSFGKEQLQTRISRSINCLTSLKRLDVLAKDFFLERFKRSNVIGQLEHLSFCKLSMFEGDIPDDADPYPYKYLNYSENLVNKLGPQCTHLHLEITNLYDEAMVGFKLKQMPNITHLSLVAEECGSVFESFCDMTNLKYLSIYAGDESEYILYDSHGTNHKLKNLTELKLNNSFYSRHAYRRREHFTPLVAVKVLSIWGLDFYFGNKNPKEEFDGRQFCAFVSYMFPKLEQFTLECNDEFAFGRIGQHFEEHFANLQKKGLYLSKDEGQFISENAGRHKNRMK